LSRRASRSATKESQLLPVERALQPSALYRCGSRSERRRQDGKEEPAAERASEQATPTKGEPDGWEGKRKSWTKVGKEGRGRRYLCDEKAARGCGRAPYPIGGTPNPAGPAPVKKLQKLFEQF